MTDSHNCGLSQTKVSERVSGFLYYDMYLYNNLMMTKYYANTVLCSVISYIIFKCRKYLQNNR